MKIVVAGGRSKADFLIGSLLEKKHEVTVINDEEAYCRYLSEKYNIPVVVGNPCKRYVLEEAEIDHADILIALRPGDPDNLAICQTAKKIFHVERAVATVSNPRNVSVFKKLGVNTAISAMYTSFLEETTMLFTSLVYQGHQDTHRASMAFIKVGFMMDDTHMTRINAGRARNTSARRMIKFDINLPLK